MARGKLRKVVGLAVLGGVAAAVVQRLRGEPAPQVSNHPTVAGGPEFRDPSPEPTAAKAAPAQTRKPAPGAAAESTTLPSPEPVPSATDGSATSTELVDDPTSSAWVAPVEGACPDGYPIKAKLASGIFHQPGGFSYERTKPDRCYATAAAAEADGLRPAKR